MSQPILVGKSAQEWFREMVSDVLTHRRLKVQEVTEFYLVNLLTSFLEKERLFVETAEGTVEAEPLAFILLKALATDRRARIAHLRRLGDTALFVSGFFGDSLSRSLVDVDYFIAMGERAYGTLADTERAAGLEELYAELSQLRSNRGLLRLYERFLHTRSERVAQLLRERGVALFSGPGAPPKRGLPQ